MPSTPLDTEHRFASITKAAEYADVHRETIYRRIVEGTLTRYQLGHALRVDLNELDRLMRQAARA